MRERCVMAKLPSVIAEEIVSFLPIKSLARFRCVSQPWSSRLRLDDDPQNPQMEAQKLLVSTSCGISLFHCQSLLSGRNYRTQLHIPFKKQGCQLEIVGSFKGLVCVCNLGDDEFEFVIWNPHTGVYRKLPSPEIPGFRHEFYGFGYDPISDDCKIVIATVDNTNKSLLPQVFSLRENSWKQLPCLPFSVRVSKSVGLYFNGTLYWKSYYDGTIFAFNLGRDEFNGIPQPSFGNLCHAFYTTFLDLVVFRGRLCLTYSSDGSGNICGVLGMENNGVEEGSCSWVKMDVDEWDIANCFERGGYVYAGEWEIGNSSEKSGCSYNPVPLCVTKEGVHIVANGCSRLLMYNPEEKRKTRCEFKVCDHGHSFMAIPYVEDLTSPYAWNE